MSIMAIIGCHRDRDNAINLPTNAGVLDMLCLSSKVIKGRKKYWNQTHIIHSCFHVLKFQIIKVSLCFLPEKYSVTDIKINLDEG